MKYRISQHTPGPWEMKRLGSRLFVEGWPDNGKAKERAEMALCCEIQGMQDDCLRPVEFHNARLIAAAPELLEACKAAIAALDEHCLTYDEQDAINGQLRAAIAKAQGGAA